MIKLYTKYTINNIAGKNITIEKIIICTIPNFPIIVENDHINREQSIKNTKHAIIKTHW
jgi:hypothetical protein